MSSLIKGKNQNESEDSAVGIIAAQTVEAYYVYSPSYARDIYMPKYLKEFEEIGKAINLGQWIRFKAYFFLIVCY